MDESEALCKARGAVRSAMTTHGDNKERAIQELHEMADMDPQLSNALAVVGLIDLQAEQSAKH